MGTDRAVVYTVGHSRHAGGHLVALLQQHGVGVLVDVRSNPWSRWPQHRRPALEAALAARGVRYVWLGDRLGGRPEDPALRDADPRAARGRIRASAGFHEGIRRLLRLARAGRCAILCAEEDPARCHRHHLVARALADVPARVLHVRGDGRLEDDAAVAGRSGRDQGELFG